MKRNIKPITQLFMFSNDLDPRIDTWFSGNIIFEHGISSETSNPKELDALIQIINDLNIGVFRHVTHVLNFKPNNLLFVKMSGNYPIICPLSSDSSYQALNKLHKFVEIWRRRHTLLQHFNNQEKLLQRNFSKKDPLEKALYDQEKVIYKLLSENDSKICEHLKDKFYKTLTY